MSHVGTVCACLSGSIQVSRLEQGAQARTQACSEKPTPVDAGRRGGRLDGTRPVRESTTPSAAIERECDYWHVRWLVTDRRAMGPAVSREDPEDENEPPEDNGLTTKKRMVRIHRILLFNQRINDFLYTCIIDYIDFSCIRVSLR